MSRSIIELRDVTMKYRITNERIETLKEFIIKRLKREVQYTDFYALQNLSLSVHEGERLAIIGHNGAGKSTLLKLISGVIEPTSGEIIVEGQISPLLELGAGFDDEFTGYENIYLNGAILGKSKSFLDSKLKKIVDFADLGQFINVPIKNYSSGMRAKLGFAIAAEIESEILIIDEILGVGDESFRKKSSDKIRELMGEGRTIILVSHDLSQVEQIADRVLWLEKGKIRKIGSPGEICAVYREAMSVTN